MKIALLVIGLAVIVGYGFLVLSKSPVGVSLDEPSFDSVTRDQINCSAANASTSVLAAQPGRASFVAANVSADVIYLCRGTSACSATSGLPLFASSTALSRFEQLDGYAGAYNCRAAGATSSLNIIYSQ